LGIAGALAGFLIVFVYVATLPAITAYKAEVLRLAIHDVLGAPESFDTLYVVDGALAEDLPSGAQPEDYDQVYPGYRDDGTQIGFAIQSAEFGFQDEVSLIFGYDAGSETILGMLVLEHTETPGLGDKIVKDLEFVGQFVDAITPLEGVKIGAGTGSQSEIDMITGATISSRAVIRIINNALERLDPMIEAYNGGGSR
jgi:electron transport complex protein RnfG